MNALLYVLTVKIHPYKERVRRLIEVFTISNTINFTDLLIVSITTPVHTFKIE
ncbi:MAG: hypothetical protein ACI8ZM_001708 [Crocinitomix sp.]|jgi:hypothetical protein